METDKCGALDGPNPGYAYRCDLDKGHQCRHYDSRYWESWGAEQKPRYAEWFEAEYRTGVLGMEWPDVPTVQLDLTDLKTIAYYMAEEEDADPTKAKIDKALKEML